MFKCCHSNKSKIIVIIWFLIIFVEYGMDDSKECCVDTESYEQALQQWEYLGMESGYITLC